MIYSMAVIKNLSKEQYFNQRRDVRQNILVNSEVSLRQRSILSDKEIIMGGIVIREIVSIKCVCENKSNVFKYVPLERVQENPSQFKVINDCFLVRFDIFDFSGVFEVLFEEPAKEVFLKLSKVKAGETIYVSGKIIPLNADTGYFFLGSEVFYKEDLCLYKKTKKEKFLSIQEKIEEIKQTEISEEKNFILGNNRYHMDVIRLFLNLDNKLDKYDYYWLASAIGDMYYRRPSQRLAQLTFKYFCEWYKSQAGCKSDVKDFFSTLYPDMELGMYHCENQQFLGFKGIFAQHKVENTKFFV